MQPIIETTMLTNDSIQFLRELVNNNNRDWFNDNKKRYTSTVKEPFEELVEALLHKYKSRDSQVTATPKECIFRIYRDTRFSKDKTPYKTHVGALISPLGRKDQVTPGYYLHIEGGRLMIGGGAYFVPKENLEKIRAHILNNPKEFNQIIDNPSFRDCFGEIQGDRYKRLPKELKEAAITQPLLANKQWYYMTELPVDLALGEKGVDFIDSIFQKGDALNAFLNTALNE